jgi:hypothetical protein
MTSRATVVHLITKLELGGAQENTLHTAAHLDRARFDVGLWSGPGGMLDAEAAAVPALDLRTFPSLRREVHPVADGRAFFDLVRALRNERHGPTPLRGGAPLAPLSCTRTAARPASWAAPPGAPPACRSIVHSIHGFGFHDGQDPRAYALFLNAERAAAHATSAFISVSYANLAEARAKGVVLPSQPAVVVRSGFDIDRFYADSLRGPGAARRARPGVRTTRCWWPSPTSSRRRTR